MYTLAGWWMTALGNLSQQRRIRHYGNSLNLNPGAFTRMRLQVSLLHTKKVRGNLRLSVFHKIQGILKLKEGNGHLIFTYPRQSCVTWTKSFRLWERLAIENLWTTWNVNAAMWENVSEYHSSSSSSSWSGLWSEFTIRQESFLEFFEEVIQRNWKFDQEPDQDHLCVNDWLQRINMERDKLAVWQNSSDPRIPRPTSSQTRCSACEVFKKTRTKLGKRKWSSTRRIIIWKICIALMENRWSSSGTYSQDSQHLTSSNRFKNSWKNQSVIQSSSKTGSSSCQCSTT